MHAERPVVALAGDGGWLVGSRAVAIDVMRDPATFTVDDPRFSTAQVVGPSMLSLDGAEHDRHRAPFTGPFGAAEVRARFARPVRAEARRLVGALAGSGEADLVREVAEPLAVWAMAEALGLPAGRAPEVVAWYGAIVHGVDAVTEGGAVPEAARQAVAELGEHVRKAVGRPGTLLAEAASGERLSPGELVSNAAVLLFGGVVTTAGSIATALFHVLSQPEVAARLREDRSLLAGAVEESLRLEPSAAVVDRYATRDVELRGCPVPAGDLVRVSLAAANRDPEVFRQPDRFETGRPNARQHVAFARGPHACLGIHLARLEIRQAVAAVLELLPDVRLDPARAAPPEGLIFRAPPTVWAEWGD